MPTTILHGETYEEALYRRFSEEAEFINKIFTRKTEMSKELIDRIRELQAKDWASPNEVEAADRIMELERELRVKDATIGQMANDMAAAQKRIELYEQALKASWPEGAIGDAFDYWNAARREDV